MTELSSEYAACHTIYVVLVYGCHDRRTDLTSAQACDALLALSVTLGWKFCTLFVHVSMMFVVPQFGGRIFIKTCLLKCGLLLLVIVLGTVGSYMFCHVQLLRSNKVKCGERFCRLWYSAVPK